MTARCRRFTLATVLAPGTGVQEILPPSSYPQRGDQGEVDVAQRRQHLTFKEAEVQLPCAIRQFALDHPPDRIDMRVSVRGSGRATDREPCRPRSARANDAPVFGWGTSEVLSAGDRRVR